MENDLSVVFTLLIEQFSNVGTVFLTSKQLVDRGYCAVGRAVCYLCRSFMISLLFKTFKACGEKDTRECLHCVREWRNPPYGKLCLYNSCISSKISLQAEHCVTTLLVTVMWEIMNNLHPRYTILGIQ